MTIIVMKMNVCRLTDMECIVGISLFTAPELSADEQEENSPEEFDHMSASD